MSKLSKNNNNINVLIIEECNNLLFEKSIETEYNVIHKNDEFEYDVYRFKTNSGLSYDVDFYETELITEFIELNNNENLFNYIDLTKIIGIDIGFTLTNRNKDVHDEYIKRTQKYEQYETFGKIVYLINEYIKLHLNIICYVIGKNTYASNLVVYKKLYDNLFSNNYEMFEGNSEYHENGAYYYIKKEMLK